MKNTTNLLTWQNFSFKLEPKFLTENQIYHALTAFHNNIIKSIENNFKLFIIFKIKFIDNQIRTISYLQIIDIDQFNQFEQIFVEYWNLRTEDYHEAEVIDILFQYKFIFNQDENIETKIIETKQINIKNDIKFSLFGGYKLPNTMNITEWGNYHIYDENKIIIYKKSSTLEYHVELFDNYQIVKLKSDDKIYLEFKDVMNNKSDLSTFTRTIKNQDYIFENGNLKLKKYIKNVSFLSSIKKSMYNSKKFITMDLETRILNNEMRYYCISIYDGNTFKSFYLSDYINEKEMLRASILYLMKRKYNNYKVYLHNFSNFDAIYLLTAMSDISDNIKPIIRDGRYINLVFKYGSNYKLYFRNSLLLLPSSLRNLAISFNVENKGIFPYKFVNNENIPLNYIGSVPEYSNFYNVEIEEYNNYVSQFNNNWDLKNETIKYCEQDCLVLYQIIDKFSDKIYNLFRIDILKYPTLSSLAFAIYRSNYLKDSKIPLITGNIYEFIKYNL